jgi:hypothetical protein
MPCIISSISSFSPYLFSPFCFIPPYIFFCIPFGRISLDFPCYLSNYPPFSHSLFFFLFIFSLPISILVAQNDAIAIDMAYALPACLSIDVSVQLLFSSFCLYHKPHPTSSDRWHSRNSMIRHCYQCIQPLASSVF